MVTTTAGEHGLLPSLRGLSDQELVTRLRSLTARERQATALLVAHLAELDTRDLHLRAGYSSLFTYCRDSLALSDDEAYNRVVAARTARRFPVVLDLLAAGDVNLTTLRLLAGQLTPENHLSVLEAARGKTKAEVEEIAARLSPRPDVPASVRRLPQPKSAPVVVGVAGPAARVGAAGPTAVSPGSADPCSPAASAGPAPAAPMAAAPPLSATLRSTGTAAATATAQAGPVPVPLPHPRRSAEVAPLSPDRYRYQLTIGGTTLEKLRLAKEMLRHALPSGDDETLLDRALTALLEDLARKKFGAGRSTDSCAGTTGSPARGTGSPARGTNPRGAPFGSKRVGASDSRCIPVAVKRAVWVRDLGRCTFVGTDAHRCRERGFLQFHHVRPHAVGGEPTVENIQLRCGAHNRYEARQYFAHEPADEWRRGHSVGGRSFQNDRP